MKEIIIDGKKYVEESLASANPTKKQIVVCDRGWVLVGDVFEEGDYLFLTNASVIRRWGTKEGLGELAMKGPLAQTELDKCPACQVHKLSVVLRMNCCGGKWP